MQYIGVKIDIFLDANVYSILKYSITVF